MWSGGVVTVLLLLVTTGSRVRCYSTDRPTCDGGNSTLPEPKTRVHTGDRLRALRELMTTPLDDMYQPLHAYIVPMDDEHQSEYISSRDAFVRYISGFTGSAGVAVITRQRAALWTDGRYFLQAEQQLDCNWYLMKEDVGAPEIHAWLATQLQPGQRVGSDPQRMSAMTWRDMQAQLAVSNIDMVPVQVNLIDHLWQKGRPAETKHPIVVQPLAFAGVSWQDKVAEVRAAMKAAASGQMKVKALLLTQLDEIAWLLNVRGRDLPHTPEFKAYAVVDMDSVTLFVDSSQLTEEVKRQLGTDRCGREAADCVTVRKYQEITSFINEMLQLKWSSGLVWVPSRWSYAGGANFELYRLVPEKNKLFKPSPIIMLKGKKNAVEIAAMKQAHLRDSVALCDFLAMLEESVTNGNQWTELDVAKTLYEYRSEQELFQGTSFTTLAAFGPHGAVIHYKATEETNAVVDRSSLLLLDSGGQYLDGTTDVTRTMHYGQPSDFQRETYTRVLMGAIDLGSVVFRKGATDSRLDILARRHLNNIGLDYLHGTGHGIGQYLQVHEAPTQLRIYQREEHPMEEGMFFSNEPGFYKDGEFGIRLETIMFAKRAEGLPHNFTGPYLAFEPVTLVPFERSMIKTELLSADQLDWLNGYHQRVRQETGTKLKEQNRMRGYRWLMDKTQPIVRKQVQDCPTHGTAVETSMSSAVTLLLAAAVFTAKFFA